MSHAPEESERASETFAFSKAEVMQAILDGLKKIEKDSERIHEAFRSGLEIELRGLKFRVSLTEQDRRSLQPA